MCCCRSSIAKCLVAFFSVLTILGGATILAIGFWLLLSADDLIGASSDSSEVVTLGDVAKRITAGSAIVGFAAIIFGIVGILVSSVQKTVCVSLFGFLSSFMFLAVSVAAYAMIKLYTVKPDQIKEFCEADYT